MNDTRKVILVVDDCAEIRRMIGRLLRPEYDCIEAASLSEAAELLGAVSVDVVLLDLVLVDSSPEETLSFAASFPCGRVITMSGLTDDTIDYAALPIRVEHHVAKPFTFRELVAHI